MHSEEQLPRISQDQVIIENQQTLSTLQAIVCPVCLTILSLPHWRCQSCDNAVCQTCMEGWWKKQPNTCIFKCQKPQFKIVKRSNTYQAIIEILKIRCVYCQKSISISSSNSHFKTCPKKPIKCTYQGCQAKVVRQEMDEHHKNCQFKTIECQYCQETYKAREIVQHRLKCLYRPVYCQNLGCSLSFPANQFEKHQIQCPFEVLSCRWCHQDLNRSQIQLHFQQCKQRLFTCEWCKINLSKNELQKHKQQCDQKTQKCGLCEQVIRLKEQKEHRYQCMFKQMIAQKGTIQRLAEQNLKLKLRVTELQDEIEQKSQNQHKLTALSLIRIKQEQRKDYERDLLRIRNSIASIKKCRNEQMSEHLKKLHLSTSLCAFCHSIRAKLEEELAPLMRLQDETVMKIKQLERIEHSTKRSIIRQ